MAATLPTSRIKIRLTNWSFSLNPGPFNLKKHVLIAIFANAGAGGVYALGIVTIMKAFYHRGIINIAALLLPETTQVGLLCSYHSMRNLVQVSLFRALHEEEKRSKGGVSRFQFFLILIPCSFAYFVVPIYHCDLRDLPDLEEVRHCPSDRFRDEGAWRRVFRPRLVHHLRLPGQPPGYTSDCDVQCIGSDIRLSIMLAISYGLGFATLTATLSHVFLFNGA
ncbi:hypothetical protein OPV22_009331 [Ensete ventricosum]|uniref:Nodulin-like domain-containing protein n=1 Tax=Ensete ventricosum TaxID=4639 RepID=A0AAV8RGQ7_ENSVE|nr:hypothetical protein OPV22_009331 [Ensete ventricosum]